MRSVPRWLPSPPSAPPRRPAMPGPAWSPGRWPDCSWLAVLPADWPAPAPRATSPSGAVRSTLCSRWLLLRWRSICWRVTYPGSGRRQNEAAARAAMKQNKSPGTNPGPSRRGALGLLGAGATLLGTAALPRAVLAHDDDAVLTEALVLRDPDIPAGGNPDGDISIVEWFDYNCPYCRKIAPEIAQVVQDDGKVRLVLKDWPILGEVSKFGARMALAAKYQGKYMAAHEAMI